ncbi:MAG: alginate export family protein [Candidatus Latescibacteria bacterium]|nr:alginate export family protein [Candidatus Latescibacterota bacterium]
MGFAVCRLIVAALLLGAVAAVADVTAGGQVRSRWELRDTDGVASDGHTATRTRAGLSATLEGGVSAFMQWQDVRIWGEEGNTLGDFSADRIDLHQGWVQFKDFADKGVDLRIGRQEIAFGGQRLVGAVGWTHQGRSFDAVRGTWRPGGSTVDVVASRLGDTSSPPAAANGTFAGVYASVAPLSGAELFLLYNSLDPATEQFTAGARKKGQAAGFDYRVEGAYQTGDRADLDVAAFFAGARVGRSISGVDLTLWYDYLSGDDETKVFDTLFATNHKFYGYADFFLNIPVHTAGGGLQDVALKAKKTLRPGLTAALDVHSFSLADDTGVSTAHLGEEVDLTVGWDYRGVARFTGGASYVLAADGFADIGRLADDALFLYLMTDVRF